MEALENQSIPYSEEAERSVLGALIVDPIKMATVTPLLEENYFYKSKHQQIYAAMTKVYDDSGALDLIVLAEQLEAYDQLESIGGRDYLLDLINGISSTVNIEHYARIVREKHILRELIAASRSISNKAFDQGDDVQNIIDYSERLILSIGEGSQNNRLKEIRNLMKEAIDKVEELSESTGELPGLASGYPELDRVTNGFQPDQLIIIAARPAVGKSAFALNIAQNVATKSSRPVAIFSLEMSALDMVNRMICAEGNINASNLRTGSLTDEEWSSLFVVQNILGKAPVYIDDSAGIKVSEIRAKCRRLKQERPDLGLIIIDYLQLIEGNGRENRQQEVSEISRQLKRLAKELNVPVIALSQLSRGLEHRQNKRPMLSDIRESGSIEQDADIVAFLYREDYHQKEDEEDGGQMDDLPDNTVEVIIAKNRSGARDTVNLLFKKEYNKFSSLSYREDYNI